MPISSIINRPNPMAVSTLQLRLTIPAQAMTSDVFTRFASSRYRFDDGADEFHPGDSRRTLITLSLDDTLPTATVLRLLKSTPNLDLYTPVKPDKDPQAFFGQTPANRVEGTSADTPLGLLYLAATFENNQPV